MDLRLTVDAADGKYLDVVVRAPAGSRCVDLGPALARVLAVGDPATGNRCYLYSHGRQAWLVDDLEVANAGLVDGDALSLVVGPSGATPGPGPGPDTDREPNPGAQVTFNRPPRVASPPLGAVHRLPAPPPEPARPRLPLVAALLPLLAGLVMYALVRSPLTLVFVALSPLMAVGSYLEGRLGGRADYRRSRSAFEADVAALRAELETATNGEAVQRGAASPGLGVLAGRVHRRETRLWERRPQDADFLELRVGTASLPSLHRVEVGEGGSALLRQAAMEVFQPLAELAGLPLTLPLAELGSVGISGARAEVEDLARWLVVQAAVMHSPSHLSICAAVPPGATAGWDWLKWLPHTDPGAGVVDGPVLCSDHASARALVERLQGVVDQRVSIVGPYASAAARTQFSFVLVLLDEALALPRGVLSRLLLEGPRVGLVFAWLGSSVRELPTECQAVLELEPGGAVRLVIPGTGSATAGRLAEDRATAAEARQVALDLAPLRDTAGALGTRTVPREVGLLEVLGVTRAKVEALVSARWGDRAPGLAAPIGVAATGHFSVDLERDGPHGLVAGTTGAGKSEALQTMVAALAAHHPPDRLTFLLIDYKGGSSFRTAVNLPHTVGLVTDLDGHLAKRALTSLRAELRRRERILRDAGARDVTALRRTGGAPPSLVIVVDEFAALAREVPEFVDGVVDLAQRGRSLGLHLVLATQRPAGVVTDSIRANTNLRVSLRVSDEAESLDVVGTPDAARVPRGIPGRSFVRTGHRDLTEVQVAYAGGPAPGAAGPPDPVRATPYTWASPLFPGAPPRVNGEETELDLLVGAIARVHAAAGGTRSPRPWLPGLPDVLGIEKLASLAEGVPGVSLGLMDLPAEQAQSPWVVDFHNGSLLALGTGGSGKTTLLRTLAHAVVRAEPTSYLYAVDCAGGDLAAVEVLPQCGAYIRGDETERITRLLRWLRGLVDQRQAPGAAPRVGGVRRYIGPPVLVLLDNYAGFIAAMESVDFGAHVDALPRLVADGRTVGVHFAITADRRAALPGALNALLSQRLVLRMADDDEYRNAGVPVGAYTGARLPPGRGFIGGVEIQCGVLGERGDPGEQASALSAAAEEMVSAAAAVSPPAIEVLPARLAPELVPPPAQPWVAVIGMEDTTLGPAQLDLSEGGQLVVGPPQSGRSNTLGVAVRSLAASTPGLQAVLFAPRRSALSTAHQWEAIATTLSQCEQLASSLVGDLDNGDVDDPGPALLVVIDDGEELLEGRTAASLEILARRGRDHGYRILAAVESRTAHRAYGGWVGEMRKSRRGLLLHPDLDIDGDIFGVRLARQSRPMFPPGRGFLVQRGGAEMVQVAAPAGP
ncbi:MAG: FtsK/SpoIIIE domain-containing protein [Candidatus Dormibacteria bacterium]